MPQLAFWLETTSQHACEMAARIGYDIVIFDMEHGVIGVEQADRLVAFCASISLKPYVRVATSERVEIQQALDSGAHAVILPQIIDLAHAERASALAKFPPKGTRGLGFSRTMAYGQAPADFPATEDRNRKCYAMIETPGALADAERIAQLATVDGLFLGPGDLSLTRGRGINSWRASDREDAVAVARAAKSAGKTWGLPASNPDIIRLAIDDGAEFLAVADDLSALRSGLLEAYSSARNVK